MIKFYEPIYSVSVKMNSNELVLFTQKFIDRNHFNIKESKPNSIAIDSTIFLRPAGWYAWIKEIVFEFETTGKHYSKLLVYGKYALFPHNFFFIPRFRNKEINKQHFIYDLREYFEGHCLPKTQ